MTRIIGLTLAGAMMLAIPSFAQAQEGAGAGAVSGAVGGAVVGGPVGAVVGATAGAVIGGISDANRPKFREYVVRERHPSYTYDGELRVGAELPSNRVTYYTVPRDYGETTYRYTIVNDRTVLVDPRTNQIVEIIE